jgi:hypothetical protein
MPTNSVTIVKYKKEIRVAQYCMFDGNPSMEGMVILEFLKNNSPLHFKRQLTKLKEVGDKLLWKYWDKCKVYDRYGNVNEEETKTRYEKTYSHLNPYIGAKVLKMIYNGKIKEVLLEKDYDIEPPVTDWLYTIDYDMNRFTVFGDFKKIYSLKELPTTNKFLDDLNDDFPSD